MNRRMPNGTSGGVGGRRERSRLLPDRHMLIKRAYPLEDFRRMAVEAGWVQPQINTSRMGFEAWMSK